MGYNQAPLFVLVALALFAASNPMAHAQILSIKGLNISGMLNCPGPGGAPLSGVPLTMNCTNILGVGVQVGKNTTGVNGTFNLILPNIGSLLGNLLSIPVCTATVNIPINITGVVCPVVTTGTGALTSTIVLATNLTSGVLGAVGGIVNLVLAGFAITVSA